MDGKFKISELTENEAGELRGGFSNQPLKVEYDAWASNGNCLGGGWGDTNSNCTGTCKNCSVNSEDQQP